MCSYALTSETSILNRNKNTWLSTAFNGKFRKNTLRAGRSLFSDNGNFKLTMRRNCNLALTNKSGKVLYQSNTVNKAKNCRAVLRNNSNIVIVSGKRKNRRVVFSTLNNTKLKGKRFTPYELTIVNTGNVIIQNRKKECVWSSFGCPKKKLQKKLNKMDPKKAVKIVKRENDKMRKELREPATRPGPVDPKKPPLKNPVPKQGIPKKPTKKPTQTKQAPKPKVSKDTANKINDILNGGDSSQNVKKVVNLVKGKIPSKEVNQLKNKLKNGATLSDLKAVADKKIAEQKKKAEREAKNPKKPAAIPAITTTSKLTATITKTTWAQKVKTIISNGGGFAKVKQVLQKNGFNNASTTYWNNIKTQVKKNNFQACVRYVVQRPAPVIPRVVYTPQVYVRRWVIRWRSYLTYYWAGYWRYNWYWRCWVWRWWWWWRWSCGWGGYWSWNSYPV